MANIKGSIAGGEASKMTMREARAEDYEAILAINRSLYAGMDYVAALFFVFLHDTSVRTYVGEVEGQIVLFRVEWLRACDQDVVHMTERVKVGYEGRGFNLYSREWARHTLQRTLTWPFYEVASQGYNEKLHGPSGKVKYTSTIRRQWNSVLYMMSSNDIKAALDKAKLTFSDTMTEVEQFNVQGTIARMKHPSSLRLLRHDGDYLACYHNTYPLKVTEKNLASLAKTSAGCQFTIQDGNTIAISIINHFLQSDKTLQAALFYYGSVDIGTWFAHVLRYLRYLLDITANMDTYKLMLHFPKDLDVSKTTTMLLPLFGGRFKAPPFDGITVVIVRNNAPAQPNFLL